jgi:DNA helicase-2/ATP-dependent DNA helicase PcrA
MELTDEQQAAVDSTARRLVLMAAPGSGKTRVVVARIVRLLRDGYSAADLLVLSFSRAAAREVKERVEAEIGMCRDLKVLTFHAWALSIVRALHDVAGVPRNMVIRDDVDRTDLITYVGRELGLRHKSVRRLWQEESVRNRYRRLLRDARATDFDGILHLFCRVLADDRARRAVSDGIQHMIVDEAQDTSPVLYAVLEALNPRRLALVGDHGQAIYGFMGAVPSEMTGRAARDDFASLQLSRNFRSRPEIVDAANRLGQLMNVKGLRQVPGVPHVPDPSVLRWLVHGSDQQDYPPAYDESPQYAPRDSVEDITAQYREVVDDVRRQLEGGTLATEIAILAYRWADLVKCATALEAAGIKTHIRRRAADPWETRGVRWVLRCLRLMVNPHIDPDLERCCNEVSVDITVGQWVRLRGQAMDEGCPTLDLVDHPAAAAIREAAKLQREHPQALASGFAELIATRLTDIAKSARLTTRQAELTEAVQTIRAWETERHESGEPAGVQDLLDWYVIRTIDGPDEPEIPEAVQLCTVHSAKGAEWDSVLVLNCHAMRGGFPSRGGAKSYQEDLRLAYVAVTRARHRCRLCIELGMEPSPYFSWMGRPEGSPGPQRYRPGWEMDRLPDGPVPVFGGSEERWQRVGEDAA